MKIFKAEGYRSRRGICCGSCGPAFEASAVVVANTVSEALGLLLTRHPESHAADWEIVEIDVTKVGTHEFY